SSVPCARMKRRSQKEAPCESAGRRARRAPPLRFLAAGYADRAPGAGRQRRRSIGRSYRVPFLLPASAWRGHDEEGRLSGCGFASEIGVRASVFWQGRPTVGENFMKVGLFITNQQTLDTDMVSALGDQIAMVHHARDRGWDSLLSGQHYLNEGNNK